LNVLTFAGTGVTVEVEVQNSDSSKRFDGVDLEGISYVPFFQFRLCP
jgi:hypothetical protein